MFYHSIVLLVLVLLFHYDKLCIHRLIYSYLCRRPENKNSFQSMVQ